MPIILDASIRGKIKFPTMPNVVSRNDDIRHPQSPSGITKTTQQNFNRLESAKGRPHLGAATSDMKSITASKNAAASKVVHGLSEGTKGIVLSTAG